MNRDKPSYYSIIPANVRYDKDLKPMEKILYSEITALANVNGYCYAKNAYFADIYDVSKETVSRWISNLCKQGYINTEIIYKDNSREIEERRIYLAEAYNKIKNKNKYIEKITNLSETKKIEKTDNIKLSTPLDENVDTPLDEKVVTPNDEKVLGPLDQNVKGSMNETNCNFNVNDTFFSPNITSINTTSMNTTRNNNNIQNEEKNKNSSLEDKLVINYYYDFIKNNITKDDYDLVVESISRYGWEKVLYILIYLKETQHANISSFKYVISTLKNKKDDHPDIVNYLTQRTIKELKNLYLNELEPSEIINLLKNSI